MIRRGSPQAWAAGDAMAAIGWLGSVWLRWLSQPVGERAVHRHVLVHGPARILEIGLGTLVRTERMLRAAARAGGEVTYVGLDRFEGRAVGDPPGMSLKEAHRRLGGLGRVRLVPGNADTALARLCNQLGQFDLVLISADNDPRHLERAWFFMQRMVTPTTTVLVEPTAGAAWLVLPRSRIDELAARAV
ncbi:MAG: class I SAM-dependent methyltransferase, partial [Planctomycetes bacterium]|nr:class I SAM-dependent methyltransferase [Planctomycetota bacterium]